MSEKITYSDGIGKADGVIKEAYWDAIDRAIKAEKRELAEQLQLSLLAVSQANLKALENIVELQADE